MPEDCLSLGYCSVFKLDYGETPSTSIFSELCKWKNAKIWFLFTRPLKIFFSKTTKENS